MLLFLATIAFALSASALPLNTTIALGNYSLAPISARDTCSAGSIVCNGPTQFAICNPPQPLVFQAVAPGTTCVAGVIQDGASGNSSATASSSVPSNTATAAPAIRPPTMATSVVTVTSTAISTSTSVSISTVTSTSTSISTVSVSTTSSTTTSSASLALTSSVSSSTASQSPAASSSPPAASPASTGAGPTATTAYKTYTGDGSTSAGWPSIDDWASFDTLWTLNLPVMATSCSQFNQPNNSPQEIADIKSAVQSAAASSHLDPRWILATIMQESRGCVRVWSTAYSVTNPGLMQSHSGTASCNTNVGSTGTGGTVQNPCPSAEINQMIQQGVFGTPTYGLVECAQQAGMSGAYRASRIYNSGSIPSDNDLSGGGATSAYSSDIANRLTLGLVGGDSGFSSG